MTEPKPMPGDLCRAIQIRNVTKVDELLHRGANVNETYRGLTPLIWASTKGDTGIARMLLMRSARVNDKTTGDGDAALHRAASVGERALVELLLNYKADIDARNREGDTPLMAAARNGRTEAIRLLIAKGADILAVNNGHESALTLARRCGRDEAATLLLEEAERIRKQQASEAEHQVSISRQEGLKEHAPRLHIRKGLKP
jgi:ankyrin repeat protein